MKKWTGEDVLTLARTFQSACALFAAVELGLFDALATPATAEALAAKAGTEPRATSALLDALAAMELLEKRGDDFALAPGVADILVRGGSSCVTSATLNQSRLLGRWSQLAESVKTGKPVKTISADTMADRTIFIEAMNEQSRLLTKPMVDALQPLRFTHFLDVGGASGSWTIAFLRAAPEARATLFDVPVVVPGADKRLREEGLRDRVTLVAGNYYEDALPAGADLAWVSAVVHQNSRAQNRDLFAKVFASLVSGGSIVIRDVVMDSARTAPLEGALFAVSMLLVTTRGGVFTFDELAEDLRLAGFDKPELVRRGELMDSLVRARKP